MENLAVLLAAGSVAQAVGIMGEVTNVNAKITRLSDAIAGKRLKPYPVNIDTRAKAYSIGLGFFLVITALFYGIFLWWSPSVNTLLALALALLIIAKLYMLVGLDKYHIEAQPLINKFSKN